MTMPSPQVCSDNAEPTCTASSLRFAPFSAFLIFPVGRLVCTVLSFGDFKNFSHHHPHCIHDFLHFLIHMENIVIYVSSFSADSTTSIIFRFSCVDCGPYFSDSLKVQNFLLWSPDAMTLTLWRAWLSCTRLNNCGLALESR